MNVDREEVAFDGVCGDVRLRVLRTPTKRADVVASQFVVSENDDRDGVAIVALRAERILLVRQFRFAVANWSWEIPRGYGVATDSTQDARREFLEETGLTLARCWRIGSCWPNAGILRTRVQIVAATVDEGVSPRKGDGEISEMRWLSDDQVRESIGKGEIEDCITLSALALLWTMGRGDRNLSS